MGLQKGAGIQVPPTHHTSLINYLAERINAKSYLEIGVQNKSKNFDRINVEDKIGVDPDPNAQADCLMTSDRFFEINRKQFDLVFIDGLHHADQVEKDFNNAMQHPTNAKLIVFHDTAPEAEYLTYVPRDKKGRWLGDVYKFICKLNYYDRVNFCTLDFDNGCTIAWLDVNAKGLEGSVPEITWEYFIANKDKLLRIVSFQQLGKIIVSKK